MGTFDSLNPFPVKGNAAAAVDADLRQLMSVSPDEPSTELRPGRRVGVATPTTSPRPPSSCAQGARFHDGKPITPEDVIFSLEASRRPRPATPSTTRTSSRPRRPATTRSRSPSTSRATASCRMIVGELPVLPKHYWEGTGANGEPRDLAKSTLEIPLGSGPYRIKEVDAGRTITYERVKDWWAKDLPVTQGPVELRRDPVRLLPRPRARPSRPSRPASSTSGASPAPRAGRPATISTPSSAGWSRWSSCRSRPSRPCRRFAFNIRRPQFQDPRVRHAFNLAFDFEWANKNLFYDSTSGSAATSRTPS